eukprot:TRINITY_DN65575_c4_g3_i1.p2 TRINITY_DN65575_c4_g3~~TRINITY_DN65575_c4_g3_i1.p2  ORF type:complete len:266 (+),score=149.77 TRINITY_DN65575_c4_g3_i1:352-1149(+)
MMKQPFSKMFTRKNDTRPFEDASAVEAFCRSSDCSLFCFGSHSKKRPHNLVLGRMFDYQLLDMFEFGVDGKSFQPMESFSRGRGADAIVRIGSKPLITFQGAQWQEESDYVDMKNFFVDFFRGQHDMPKINLAGIDRLINITVDSDGVIYIRQFSIKLKKSGTRIPKVALTEVGPRLDLNFRRRKSAPNELRKLSYKIPMEAKQRKKKNVSAGTLGVTEGRVHMHSQNLNKIRPKKTQAKALGQRKRKGKSYNDAEDGRPKRSRR